VVGNSYNTGVPGAAPVILGINLTGRQGGGPVRPGTPYIVGEHGPELFMPGSSSTIIPNGVGGVSIGSFVINAPAGMSVDELATAVQSKLLQLSRQRVNMGLS
jgi:hypothetical protein